MRLNKIITGLFALSMLSLHVSPALASISMGLLFLVSIVHIFGIRLKQHHGSQIEQKISFSVLLSVILISVMLGLEWYHGCGFTTSKTFKNYVPLFFLPFISLLFDAKQGLDIKSELSWLRPTLNIPLIWIILGSSMEYASHHSFYSEMILESKPMPLFSRVYHIEFSLILAMQLLFTICIYKNQWYNSDRRWMIHIELILLFLGLHFLSARTGLISFWIGTLVLFFGDIRSVSIKWYILGIVVLSTLIFSVSSIRNRLINTWEDLSAVVHGEDLNHKSFGQRWESWKAGVYLINEHPLWGVGPCHFEELHQQAYVEIKSALRADNRIGPHNQWIQWIAEYGWCTIVLIVVYLHQVFRISQRRKSQVLSIVDLQNQHHLETNSNSQGVESESLTLNGDGNPIQAMVYGLVACLVVASMFESILERQAGMWMLIFAVAIKNIPKK